MKHMIVVVTVAALLAPLSHVQGQEYRVVERSLFPENPEAPLTDVQSLRVGPRGRLYIYQRGVQTVHAFSPDGRNVRSLGRRGDGPGEFRATRAGGFLGDTVYVIDRSASRVTFFGPDGELLRTTRAPRFASDRTFRQFSLVGLLDGRAFLMAEGYNAETVHLLDGLGQSLLRVDPLTEAPDTILRVRVSNRLLWIPISSGGVIQAFQPFSDADLWALSNDGRMIARLRQGVFEDPIRLSATLSIITAAGQTVREWPIRVPSTPLTGDVIDEWIGAFLARGAADSFQTRRNAERAIRRSLFRPAAIPLRGLLFDSDGRIWVEAWAGPDHSTWRAFGPRGDLLITTNVPISFQFMDAKGLKLWGIETDSLDVPRISRLVLAKGEDELGRPYDQFWLGSGVAVDSQTRLASGNTPR